MEVLREFGFCKSQHGVQQNVCAIFEILRRCVLSGIVAESVFALREDHGGGAHAGEHLCVVPRA